MWDKNISKQVKEYFGESLNGRTVYAKLKQCKNENILFYIKNILKNEPAYQKETNVIRLIIQNKDLEICPVCKRKIKYDYLIQGKHHCSLACSNKNPIVKEKKKISTKMHYGVEFPSQTENFRKAIKNRNEEKAKETRKKTCLKRFGCEYSFQSKEVKEKSKKTLMKKYGRSNGFLKYSSKTELELVDFCHQFFNNLIQNDRKLIFPYELDIVIPERKLAIEFNGLFWHQLTNRKSGYHLMKTEMCEKIGYRLIHIWEDEWNEETKERLKQIFENKEVIDYSKMLDRCWFSILNFKNVKIYKPKIENHSGYLIENCGYLEILS